MSDDIKHDRRTSSRHLIDNLLNERNQLLKLLFQFTNIEPEDVDTPDKELLEEFCQLLVDYIAAGHFSLFERIVSGEERRKAMTELAMKVHPSIEKSTQITLEFNEKYTSDRKSDELNNLQKDLSILGEVLTTRFELEDQLIAEMLNQQNLSSNQLSI